MSHWKLNDGHEKQWACPLCPSKRCASFLSSVFGLELGLSRNVEIGTKSVISFTCVSFELDKWPRRTIEYLLYTTRSFVHHFTATCECWNWSYPLETRKSCQIGDFWSVRHWNCTDDLEKSNMTSLLYPSKLCASFICYLWTETVIIMQKYWHQGKIAEFLGHATLKLDR